MGSGISPQRLPPISKARGPDILITATPLLPGAVAGATIVSKSILARLWSLFCNTTTAETK